MKQLIVLALFLSVPFTGMSQVKPKVVEYYKRHDQVGPFYLRWYTRLRGEQTTIWIESLTLTDDGRFEHYSSTGCLEGFTYGTWTREKDRLILYDDSVWGMYSLSPEPYKIFIKKKKFLYLEEDDTKWVMKRLSVGSH